MRMAQEGTSQWKLPKALEGVPTRSAGGKGTPGFASTLGHPRVLDCKASPKISATPLNHFLLSFYTCRGEAHEGVCARLRQPYWGHLHQ